MEKIKQELEEIIPEAEAKRIVEFDMIYDPVFYLSSGLIELLKALGHTDLAKYRSSRCLPSVSKGQIANFENEVISLNRLEDITGKTEEEKDNIRDEFLIILRRLKMNTKKETKVKQ